MNRLFFNQFRRSLDHQRVWLTGSICLKTLSRLPQDALLNEELFVRQVTYIR